MQFTQRELQGFLRNRNVIIFLILAILIVTAGNPVLFQTLPNFKSRLFYWTLSVVLYVLVIPYYAQAAYSLWHRVSARPMPHFPTSVPLILALSWLAEHLPIFPDLLSLPRVAREGSFGYLVNTVIGVTLETLALLWLWPLFNKAREHNPEPDKEFVVFSGKSIPLSILRLVHSSEHFLIVTTDIGVSRYRTRMKDFLEQVDARHGIQPHRSYWVAKDEAVELSGRSIKTRGGGNIPVSRGRVSEVRAWFYNQSKPH